MRINDGGAQLFLYYTGPTLNSLIRGALWVPLVLLFTVAPACDSGSSNGSAESNAPSGSSADINNAVVGDGIETETPQPEECTARADATLSSDQGEIVYADAIVSAAAQHAPSAGCINELSLTLSSEGSCPMSLTFQTLEGEQWGLTAGSFTVDAECGEGLDESTHGDYTLNVALSTGGLDGQPMAQDAASAGCQPSANIALTGLALFDGEGKTLEVNLNGLSLNGGVLSSPSTNDSCPAAISACPNRTCGTDDYGKSCGTCPDGEACVDGGCRVWNCPPGAPFGTTPGTNLTDVELRDCDGNPVFLHELCGADVGFFNLLAGW